VPQQNSSLASSETSEDHTTCAPQGSRCHPGDISAGDIITVRDYAGTRGC
jgi:hypothetical protein